PRRPSFAVPNHGFRRSLLPPYCSAAFGAGRHRREDRPSAVGLLANRENPAAERQRHEAGDDHNHARATGRWQCGDEGGAERGSPSISDRTSGELAIKTNQEALVQALQAAKPTKPGERSSTM